MKAGGQEATATLQARDDWGHPSHSDWGEGVAGLQLCGAADSPACLPDGARASQGTGVGVGLVQITWFLPARRV